MRREWWPESAAPESVVRDCLNLVASVERDSTFLRGAAGEPRRFRIEGNVAFADGAETIADLPFQYAVPSGEGREDLPRARADLVLMGRPSQRLRVRAFYDAANVSVTIHGAMSLLRTRNRVHEGASIQEKVGAQCPLVVPRPRDRGRRLRHAWMVEDLLRGRETTEDDWPSVVSQVADGLWHIWTASGLQMEPARRLVGRGQMSAALGVFDLLTPLTAASALRDRLEQAARLSGRMAVGWCHGDPTPSNVIRLTDNRLALLDWEAAGRRPIAYDAVKVLGWLEDPLTVTNAIGTRVASATGITLEDWRRQLMIETLRALGRTRSQRARAVESGTDGALWIVDRRRRRMLRLLVALAESPLPI